MAERIWVENNHYNKVKADAREAARKKLEADRKQRAERERLHRLEREAAQAAAEDARLLEARIQTETDRLLAGIDSVSYEMRAALLQHIAQTQQDMDGLRNSVRTVQQQAVQLDGKIDDLENSVAARFQELAESLAGERDRAQLYANQYNALVEQIEALNPRKLTPGAMENELTPVTNFLAMNMENGDYQAGIGLAQSKIPEALALQVRLEQLNAAFRDLREEAAGLIRELRQRIGQLQDTDANKQTVTVGKNKYEYDGQIAYWTNELFLVVLENFDEILRRYETAEADMDLETMGLAVSQLNQVALQLAECEELAAEEFRLFAMVQNMAASIHNVLAESGVWELTDSGFAEDDSRRAYQMTYIDGDGDTASFVILPNREVLPTGEPGEVQFLVGVCDGDTELNPFRGQILREAILARLGRENIRIGAHNKNPQYGTDRDRASFLQEATRQGDDIKENRLAIVRQQLELTV